MIRTCLLILYIFSACLANAQGIKTKEINYNGNVITLLTQYDTVVVQDPETGEERLVVTGRETLDRLNGKKIYFYDDAMPPIASASQPDFKTYLSSMFGQDVRDARLEITAMINENGKLGYFTVTNHPSNNTPAKAKEIETKLAEIKFIPAQKEGKAVPYGFYLR
jgi:hypothetical protein